MQDGTGRHNGLLVLWFGVCDRMQCGRRMSLRLRGAGAQQPYKWPCHSSFEESLGMLKVILHGETAQHPGCILFRLRIAIDHFLDQRLDECQHGVAALTFSSSSSARSRCHDHHSLARNASGSFAAHSWVDATGRAGSDSAGVW